MNARHPVLGSDWFPEVDMPAGAWHDPLPLESELPPVEPITADLLPTSLRLLVRDVAERMQLITPWHPNFCRGR